MPLTLIFPADRPGDATYASLAAQVEVGLARVVQERRAGQERRERKGPWEHGQRGAQRRQAGALPGGGGRGGGGRGAKGGLGARPAGRPAPAGGAAAGGGENGRNLMICWPRNMAAHGED